MENWICATCGVQYAASEQPPARCPICEDQRQYIGYQGQRWTTLESMRQGGYRNTITTEEPGLTGIVTEPSFAIGQRALLAQTPGHRVSTLRRSSAAPPLHLDESCHTHPPARIWRTVNRFLAFWTG